MKFTNNKSYFYANVSFLNFENSLKTKINIKKGLTFKVSVVYTLNIK